MSKRRLFQRTEFRMKLNDKSHVKIRIIRARARVCVCECVSVCVYECVWELLAVCLRTCVRECVYITIVYIDKLNGSF